ncbi:hypothetical protein EVAR_33662_1 [Eumeta japonica]|uniref:Uncharacterized protein n=1 Tax=Eumeta variegata TaxID=151549 RepID=A0A4C1VNZ1_EUMVA|nr:hypothetical protein EVAR_33662_1 [Eumeta japonica]
MAEKDGIKTTTNVENEPGLSRVSVIDFKVHPSNVCIHNNALVNARSCTNMEVELTPSSFVSVDVNRDGGPFIDSVSRPDFNYDIAINYNSGLNEAGGCAIYKMQQNWCSCTPTATCVARAAINQSEPRNAVHQFAHKPQESVLRGDCEGHAKCGLTRQY